MKIKSSSTNTQGLAATLLTYAISTSTGMGCKVPITLVQTDMTTENGFETLDTSTDPWRWQYDTCIAETEPGWDKSEALFVKIKATYIICSPEWNSPVTGTVEAKMRIVRKHWKSMWKLHYLMLIFPDLSQGHIPTVYVRNQFKNIRMFEMMMQNPGRIYTTFGRTNGQGRCNESADCATFMKMCDLIENLLC